MRADTVVLETPAVDGRRGWSSPLAVATVLAVVLRLPMLIQPMTADEGGYAGVARGWADGARLYRDVWVDRPQGLLVLYRFVDWVDGGHALGIRVAAIVFGVALVWAVAWAVRGLAGAAAGGVAAVLTAAVTSVPVLEGFAANGELLAGTLAALSVACAVAAIHRPVWWRWAACGVAGGVAISLKQSGFDGVLAVLAWLGVVAVIGPDRRRAARRLALVLAGLAVPVALLAIDGVLLGWDRWLAAMGGYRLHAQSAVSAADWDNLERTARIAGPILGAVVVAAVVGAVVAPATVRANAPGAAERAWLVLVAWPLAAVLGFLSGGGFWRHYWVQLGAPLAALAGVGVAWLIASARWRAIVVAALVAPAIIATGWVVAAPRDQWMVRANDDWRAPLDARVAAWLREHRAAGDEAYPLCAAAGLYGDAALVPRYPYLWMVEVHEAPGAEDGLVAYLADPARAPEYIAQYQTAGSCDVSGRLQAVLDAAYSPVATVGAVTILRRDAGAPGGRTALARS